jgi:hypothetical protein
MVTHPDTMFIIPKDGAQSFSAISLIVDHELLMYYDW